MFGLHIWLPKAHVEAPVYGSILLAAIMLKLGGLGLTRVLPLCTSSRLVPPITIRLLGIVSIRLLCVFLFDLKIIVAYSSVAHMALVIISIFTMLNLGVLASLLIIISHAFTSSIIFFGVTKIYSQTLSRRILLNTGNLVSNFKFSLLWILCLTAGIATPPMLNFFREIISFIVIVSVYSGSSAVVLITVFLRGAYSLIIFSSTQHGKLNFKYTKIRQFSKLEYLNRFAHRFLFLPTIFILILFF
jgi:NADH-ubiquinone oxidoreductase chain 4